MEIAADQRIVAAAAEQPVHAAATVEDVVVVIAVEIVDPVRADDILYASIGVARCAPNPRAIGKIDPDAEIEVAPLDRRCPLIGDGVVAGAAVKLIVTRTAVQRIVPAATERIIEIAPGDGIVPSLAEDHVEIDVAGLADAEQRVIALAAEERLARYHISTHDDLLMVRI